MHEKNSNQEVTRRNFFHTLGLWSFLATVGGSVVGSFRFLFPEAFAEPSTKIKIGRPDNFSISAATKLDKEKMFVFRDYEGIYVISSECTHLGCIVAQSEMGFDCPCHGSKFDSMGAVKGGPAPAPLKWLKVQKAPDGQLVVDKADIVKPGTKFAV